MLEKFLLFSQFVGFSLAIGCENTPLPFIANGFVEQGISTHGAQRVIRCNIGYEYTTSFTNIVCNQGYWSIPMTQCVSCKFFFSLFDSNGKHYFAPTSVGTSGNCYLATDSFNPVLYQIFEFNTVTGYCYNHTGMVPSSTMNFVATCRNGKWLAPSLSCHQCLSLFLCFSSNFFKFIFFADGVVTFPSNMNPFFTEMSCPLSIDKGTNIIASSVHSFLISSGETVPTICEGAQGGAISTTLTCIAGRFVTPSYDRCSNRKFRHWKTQTSQLIFLFLNVALIFWNFWNTGIEKKILMTYLTDLK